MNKKEIAAIGEALRQKKGTSGGADTLMKAAESINKVGKQIAEQFNAPLNPTRRTKATVLVMLSHDYNHFEASIELTGENISLVDIDNARKDAQRLCDKAVGQYRTAKEKVMKRLSNSYERMQLEKEVTEINKKKEEFLTPDDKAKIKAFADYNYAHQYDYNDDSEYPAF